MTASELVDLAAEGALAALPGDVWLADRSWTRPQWTVEELDGGQGRTNHLGGAARPQRGRHRRIGDRQHLAAGRRAGRRADRARLGIHRRHRDPGDRRRRPRRDPRTSAARDRAAARQRRGAVAVAGGHQRRHRGLRRLGSDRSAPDVRAAAARAAAHRGRHSPRQELLSAAVERHQTPAAARARPAVAGSPSWWHGRCSRRCGPNWAACCSRWAASTRPPANC